MIARSYIVSAAALLAVLAPAGRAGDLAGYRQVYETELGKIEDAHLARLAKMPPLYLKSLGHLSAQMQRRGKLEDWQAVQREAERFKRDREVTEADLLEGPRGLFDLQQSYIEGRKRLDLEHAQAITDLTRHYLKVLARHKVALTRQGRMPAAMQVQKEAEQVTVSAVFTNAATWIKTNREQLATGEHGLTAAGNVALAEQGSEASAPRNPEQLNDGNTTEYDGSNGFASGDFPCEFRVDLPRVYALRQIRILLWDGDDRQYRYKAETSEDGETWQLAADHTASPTRGWQDIRFGARPVKHIRVTGLHNTVNRGFHIVEIEAYCRPVGKPGGEPSSGTKLVPRLSRPSSGIRRIGD